MNTRSMGRTLRGSVLGLSLAALAFSGLVAAQPADGQQGPHGQGHRGEFAEHWFEHLDANKDGQVTQKEAEDAAGNLFDRLDANHDGAVTREESDAGAQAIRHEMLTAHFKQLDANGDGHLTQDEAKIPQRFFDRLDTNNDHVLSLDEFLAQPDFGGKRREFEFDRADANHDGQVTRAEALQAAKARFEKLDTNHDGVVTREEFQAHLEQMRKMHQEKRGQQSDQDQQNGAAH
jgi:Ca2+-binding EF-hand superfamily protein